LPKPSHHRAVVLLAGLSLSLPLFGGCDDAPKHSQPGTATQKVQPAESLAWRAVALPVPAGAAGRLILRDAATCGGNWYVAGAVAGADGATRPAAWVSRDGRVWRPMPMGARSTYGKIAVLYAAGCRDGALAAIGAMNGGAHGNPRVTQWRLRPDGTMDEVLAAFELYGGPDAVNVGRIAGGPAGWLIAGNRVGGAAVWVAGPAAADFRLIARAAQLAGDGALATEAIDAAAYQGGWVVVGGGRRAGQRGGDPMAWTSPDGLNWRRMALSGNKGGDYRVLQRVVATGDGLVAVGVDGDHFAAWRLDGGGWQPADRFSTLFPGAAQVQGLAGVGGRVWAAVNDGRQYTLWASPTAGRAWRQVQLPLSLAAAGADHALTVTAAAHSLLLLADDSHSGQAWLATT
jgi:hypothetical protein